jgi:hypothetical protein
VSLCNSTVSTYGVTLNITRANFAALGIAVAGRCMTVSLCEVNSDTTVGPGNNVDLSWTVPAGVTSALPTCGAANCNSASATLLSRINIPFTNQTEDIVNIISRTNKCLTLAVRLTVSPDCIAFGGVFATGGGLPLPVPGGR